jgi:hypothetical protein
MLLNGEDDGQWRAGRQTTTTSLFRNVHKLSFLYDVQQFAKESTRHCLKHVVQWVISEAFYARFHSSDLSLLEHPSISGDSNSSPRQYLSPHPETLNIFWWTVRKKSPKKAQKFMRYHEEDMRRTEPNGEAGRIKECLQFQHKPKSLSP